MCCLPHREWPRSTQKNLPRTQSRDNPPICLCLCAFFPWVQGRDIEWVKLHTVALAGMGHILGTKRWRGLQVRDAFEPEHFPWAWPLRSPLIQAFGREGYWSGSVTCGFSKCRFSVEARNITWQAFRPKKIYLAPPPQISADSPPAPSPPPPLLGETPFPHGKKIRNVDQDSLMGTILNFDGPNRQSLVFSERGQLSQAIPQVHVEWILHQRTPIARFKSQRNERRVYEDQTLCF